MEKLKDVHNYKQETEEAEVLHKRVAVSCLVIYTLFPLLSLYVYTVRLMRNLGLCVWLSRVQYSTAAVLGKTDRITYQWPCMDTERKRMQGSSAES